MGGGVVYVCCLVSLFGAGVSAVGTTLLQSPGCNEGKARNVTLGKHGTRKLRAPTRSGTVI